VGGLLSSTFITLVLVPVVYTVLASKRTLAATGEATETKAA
jgi:Cu/Ag efflux pump CusA